MLEHIIIDPDICHGKSCIRGLRYPLETVLEWLASGMTAEEILTDVRGHGTPERPGLHGIENHE